MSRKIQVKCLVAVVILAMSSTALAEIPVVEWTRQLGTASTDLCYGVSVDSNGNAYVTGFTNNGLDGNTNAGGSDLFLIKYDTNGNKLWTEQLGSASIDTGRGVSIDGSGNVYVTGETFGNLDGNTKAGYTDIFLTKYDTDGNKLWTKQQGTTSFDYGYGVSVDGNDNVYITGYSKGDLDGNTNAGNYDVFLAKYDTDGNKLWTEQLGTIYEDYGYDVSVDNSGNAYVTGYTKGGLDGNTKTDDSFDMFLVKYDTNGTKLWTEQLGTTNLDYGHDVSVDDNDNIYVTGHTGGGIDGNTNAGSWDMFLTKYDRNGTKLWTEQLGSASDDQGKGVSVDGNGNVYVTGYTGGGLDDNTNAGYHDMFLTKYDTDGNKLWTCQQGSASGDLGYDVSIDSNGNAYVAGYTDGALNSNTNAGNYDLFLIKISTVPEPNSIAMLAGIALMVLLYRNRKHV